MKALILTLAMTASINSSGMWSCTSYGTDGAYGWGQHVQLAIAQQMALDNCFIRSIGWCNPPVCY